MTNYINNWIAKREQLEEAATEGPWCATHGPRELPRIWSDAPQYEAGEFLAKCSMQDDLPDAEFIADARTSLPTALAALRAVLEMHRPVEVGPSDTICDECSFQLPNGRYFGKVVEWPCPTVRAVEAALRSES